jgi:hypothetical protein
VVFGIVDMVLVMIVSRNMRICSVSKDSCVKALKKVIKDSFNSVENGDFVSAKIIIVSMSDVCM